MSGIVGADPAYDRLVRRSDFRSALLRVSIFRRQMSVQVHTVVQNAANLDMTFAQSTVQQHMSRTTNSTTFSIDTITAVEEMVRSSIPGDLIALHTAQPFWVVRDVYDGLYEQGLVPEPSSLAIAVMGPVENRRDIVLRRWREGELSHCCQFLFRSSADLAARRPSLAM